MIFLFKHMVKKFFLLKKFNLFLSISTYTAVLIAQQNPVNISSSIKSPARAGEVVSVEVSVSMEDQWHIYSIHKITEGPLPTEINISGDAVGSIGPVFEPEPKYAYDPGFDSETYYHAGDTKFNSFFRLKRDVQPGKYPINIEVYYMVCNERLCYPPKVKNSIVYVEVEDGPPRIDRTSFLSATTPSKNNNNQFDNSLIGILLLAFGGAVISWIMPCVYPMIPIIISFFGKMSEEKNVGRITIASFYGLGIAGTFVAIGLVVSILSWGVTDIATKSRYANLGNFIATDPFLNLGLGILFIFFALWMFGVVNINVAGSLVNKTDQAGQSAKSAYLGAFLLGVAFSITSFSCTVPVVGTLLVVAATGTAGGMLTSLYGMVVYGIIFAAPFVALSLFPKTLEKIPNSGSWMDTLKISFGFIELAAAVKFLWVPDLEWDIGVLPRNVVLIIFIIISLALIGYLAGLFRIGSSTNIKPFYLRKGRIFGIILTGLFLYPITMSVIHPPTYHYDGMPRLMDEFIEALVPPPPTEDEIARQEGWFVDQYNEALDEASEKGKPLFIDFTGVYCANCRVMERRVFPQDEVKEQLDKMVLARLYVDKKDSLSEVYAKMQFERYNQATQPYYVILDPKDESTLADTGGYIPNGFSGFLEKGNNKFYNKEIK